MFNTLIDVLGKTFEWDEETKRTSVSLRMVDETSSWMVSLNPLGAGLIASFAGIMVQLEN